MAGYTSLLDMLNGGGAGTAGDEFQGGLFSDLLNAMGMRPMGYNDRAAAPPSAPTVSTSGGYAGGSPPMTPTPAPAPAGLGPFGMMPGAHDPVTASPLPAPGAIPDEELMAMLQQFLKQAPTATGYGPR